MSDGTAERSRDAADARLERSGGASTRTYQPGAPSQPGAPQAATLADILERVLDKGIIIAGDIRVNLLDIELLTIKLRLLVVSVDKAQEMGIDWWRHDPMLTVRERGLDEENRELRERLAQLEGRADDTDDTDADESDADDTDDAFEADEVDEADDEDEESGSGSRGRTESARGQGDDGATG